jgi:hypothetical protein
LGRSFFIELFPFTIRIKRRLVKRATRYKSSKGKTTKSVKNLIIKTMPNLQKRGNASKKVLTAPPSFSLRLGEGTRSDLISEDTSVFSASFSAESSPVVRKTSHGDEGLDNGRKRGDDTAALAADLVGVIVNACVSETTRNKRWANATRIAFIVFGAISDSWLAIQKV